MPSRRVALTVLVAALATLAATVLFDVLGTVFFALTVTSLLAPLYRRLNDRLPPWPAAAATTVVVTTVLLVALASITFLLARRADDLIRLIREIPPTFTFVVLDAPVVVDVSTLLAAARGVAGAIAVDAATALPALALKLTVFAFLVFALLIHHHDVERAVIAAIPEPYHDVTSALADRARATLYAIYVLQAATGLGTLLIALPVFFALDYSAYATLALAAGVLQFLPVVGPSVLVLALAAFHLTTGDVTSAVLVLVVAGTLVAWLPDVLIRPRLARETANLPGSLYFVGFTGGLLTLGPVGIIAGPLVAALLAEGVRLLAAEQNRDRVS
ncbi:AI-2E family transporter [Salarchaeum sp. JOR-1]|uniref:AI-2E family transporter n=1 Tax=Salarchaeum sp. JOR-1 TaxID=2599399 RepID=UPI0011983D26|nr:AI-2E family transporter [Salarchaeum sp. JOR-1]QDX40174.1 AI-2E family transporter [Salarchaeum sp. JOR-1]